MGNQNPFQLLREMSELEFISQSEFRRTCVLNTLWGENFSGLIGNIQLTLKQYWLEEYGSTYMWIFFSKSAYYNWRRCWHPTPVLLPGNSHGWRSPVGCSPWGREESDTPERLHFHFSLSCVGEGNGNPLQCSCLENPRGGGAWWAAIYGVAQSRTRLK